MVIRYDSLEKVKEHIDKYKSNIVIYGAGMIGRVVMPYIITEYGLLDNLLFYIDSDKRKQRDIIPINGRNVEIKSPECLDRLPKNTIILITNSNYSGVLNMLDSIEKLKDNTCVIIPVILAMQAKQLNRAENKKNGSQRIPKVINYCWFSRSQMPDYLENVLNHGRNIALITRLSAGMKIIMMLKRICICVRHMKLENGDLFQILQDWIYFITMVACI